jgi:gluconokinase
VTRFVVMGASGCGKSRIGAGFAAAKGLRFVDGDALHPAENIAKMSRGEPLTDADRAPWLRRVGEVLSDDRVVIACSALKRSYRDLIRGAAGAEIVFLYLRGRRETLLARMTNREGHFMPPALLDSQLAILEEPEADEPHRVADIELPPERIIAVFQR